MAKSETAFLSDVAPLILVGGGLYLVAKSGLLQRIGGGAGEAIEGLGSGIGSAGSGIGSGIGSAFQGVGSGISGIAGEASDIFQDVGSIVEPPASFFEGLASRIRQEFEQKGSIDEAKFAATFDEEVAIAESKARGRLQRRDVVEGFKTRGVEFLTSIPSRIGQAVTETKARGRQAISAFGSALFAQRERLREEQAERMHAASQRAASRRTQVVQKVKSFFSSFTRKRGR